MAALISLSLWCIWLSVLIPRSAASEVLSDSKIIKVQTGQNVTLKCRAPNSNILVVEWRKAGLKEEYVLLYRDGHLYPDNQHPSFKNRVDLQDRQMKDGDVSLILKNVTAADDGTYECRVITRGANRRKRANLDGDPIRVITLTVDPSGQTGGLIIGLSVVAVVFSAGAVLFLLYRKHIQCNQVSHHPPAEPQIEFSENFLNSESPAAEYNDRNGLEANNFHQHSTRIPDVTLTLENELLHPQETAGLLPESDMRVQ